VARVGNSVLSLYYPITPREYGMSEEQCALTVLSYHPRGIWPEWGTVCSHCTILSPPGNVARVGNSVLSLYYPITPISGMIMKDLHQRNSQIYWQIHWSPWDGGISSVYVGEIRMRYLTQVHA